MTEEEREEGEETEKEEGSETDEEKEGKGERAKERKSERESGPSSDDCFRFGQPCQPLGLQTERF